jgi:hypothetical protein
VWWARVYLTRTCPQPMKEGIHRVIDAASQLDPASEIGQTAANRNALIKAIKAELKQRLSIEPRARPNYGRYLSIFTLNPETTKSCIGCSPARLSMTPNSSTPSSTSGSASTISPGPRGALGGQNPYERLRRLTRPSV